MALLWRHPDAFQTLGALSVALRQRSPSVAQRKVVAEIAQDRSSATAYLAPIPPCSSGIEVANPHPRPAHGELTHYTPVDSHRLNDAEVEEAVKQSHGYQPCNFCCWGPCASGLASGLYKYSH